MGLTLTAVLALGVVAGVAALLSSLVLVVAAFPLTTAAVAVVATVAFVRHARRRAG